MAWPNDKANYLSPEKSKLQKKIDEETLAGKVAGAVGLGATMPARAIGTLAKNSPVARGIGVAANAAERVGADMAATDQNRARVIQGRENVSRPDPQKFGLGFGTVPQPIAPVPQRDGIGSSRIDPATQESFKNAMRTVNATQPTQVNPEAKQRLVNQYSMGARYNGAQQVGNMDVTFDKSVPLGARRAFMAQPVAPTGQMAQYEKYMNTPRGQNFGVQKIDNTPPPPMGWRERLALKEAELRNENNIATTGMNNAVASEGNQVQYALGADRNNIDVRGQDLTAQAAAERNRIDAITADANSQTSQIDAEGKNLDIQDKLKKQRLWAKRNHPDTTEQERMAIDLELGNNKKGEYDTIDQFDDQGMKTGELLYNKATGQIMNGGGEAATTEAPQAALDHLAKNPKDAAYFKRKYGYLPEGF